MMYPRFEDLHVEPDYLQIDIVAVLREAGWISARARRRPRATSGDRAYASRYVGVTTVRGRWVGCWGRCQGPRRPLTPEGELLAARDRAQALGRTELEVRS